MIGLKAITHAFKPPPSFYYYIYLYAHIQQKTSLTFIQSSECTEIDKYLKDGGVLYECVVRISFKLE